MADAMWWVLVVVLLVGGLMGTVLPALPGTALILGGILLGAWIDDFTRIGTPTLILVTVLAVLAWVLEYVAGMLGARKAGASRWALVGAALGTVVGLLMGLVGVLFMPLVGAALGELWARKAARRAGAVDASSAALNESQAMKQDLHKALHVGVAAWLGMMAGMLAKVVLAFMMVGVFLGTLLI